MRKTYAITLVCFMVFCLIELWAKSSGAPPHSTGAPMENTCNVSNCHAGKTATPNTGTGKTFIKFEDATNEYEPGKQYVVTVGVEQHGIIKYGFQATSVGDDNTACGEVAVMDKSKTIMHPPEAAEMLDRRYIDQSINGNTFKNGKAEWQFYWNAPSDVIQPVTLYVAYLAGNNDTKNTGDYVYTNKLKLMPKVVKSVRESNASVRKMNLE